MDYDRSLSEEFIQLLKPRGKLRWLVEYVKKHDDLDIIFAKDTIKVYFGGTRILEIKPLKRKNNLISINADKKYKKLLPELYGWKNIDENEEFEPNITTLISAIKEAGEKNEVRESHFSKVGEGFYQTKFSRMFGICSKPDDDFVIIDREVIRSHFNREERSKLFVDKIQEKYKNVLSKLSKSKDWKFRSNLDKEHIGEKMDFLGLDKDGNFLVIEMKYGKRTSEIYLSPVKQLGPYYEIFRSYYEENKEKLQESVFKMLKQKQDVGLINNKWQAPKKIKGIKPVLVVAEYNERSSAIKSLNEILELARKEKELGSDFMKDLKLYNFSKEGRPFCLKPIQ